MNYSTAVFLINDNVRAIAATYETADNAPRTIFKTFDKAVAVDDFIIVPTETRHKMTVCKVVEVDIDLDLETGQQIGWVIGRIALADYKKMLDMETAAIETIKSAEKNRKREELRKSLMADSEQKLKALPIAAISAGQNEPPQS